jgi:molybdate transport system regulatory protein
MENNKVSSKVKAKSVKESHDLAVKLHMWLEKDGGVFFGSGRYELGCLKSASESLGLSYRGAWGKLKRTEEIIGEKLVYKKNNKEGYMLTDLGRNLMDEFGSFFEDVSQYASKKGTEIVKKLL